MLTTMANVRISDATKINPIETKIIANPVETEIMVTTNIFKKILLLLLIIKFILLT